jgi:GR25 family glycosyltransferase involved in LPS biosynthesis
MKAFAIVIRGNEVSEFGYNNLCESSKKVGNKFPIIQFEAVTPSYINETLKEHNVTWNYPWEGEVSDFASGLTKRAYRTRDPKARIGCALSHYTLWKRCINMDILGINNPIGCTFKSREYYQHIIDNKQLTEMRPPKLAPDNVPQGLAGNSAYIIKPNGAKHMLKLVKEFGLWPNDAIMCRQLVPKLGVTRKFYTHIQNLKSTTTL